MRNGTVQLGAWRLLCALATGHKTHMHTVSISRHLHAARPIHSIHP